jgi:hypothetical protein
MSGRADAFAELTRALEAVLSASAQGHAHAAVPLLEAAIVAGRSSADSEIIQLCLAAQMAADALCENRVGPARRFAGAALRDVRARQGMSS